MFQLEVFASLYLSATIYARALKQLSV